MFMKHQGTIQLETDRRILRRFAMDDAQDMYKNWAFDYEVAKYLTWQPHKSEEETKEILEDWTSKYINDDYYHWVLVIKETNTPIGAMNVVSFKDKVKSATIGYCIGRNWWRQGYTSEALQVVMDFLFDEVGVLRIEAEHDVNNSNSGRVMKKCGMKYEGTHRQAGRNIQGICDLAWYGMLVSDR